MKKNAGIWLDKRHAIVILLEDGKEKTIEMSSNVEEGNVRGGSRTSTPYGSQDAVHEKHLMEKRKHQLKDYFNRIVNVVKNCAQILIIGPAETKVALYKHLHDNPEFASSVLHQENADSMTLPQLKAKIRNYF